MCGHKPFYAGHKPILQSRDTHDTAGLLFVHFLRGANLRSALGIMDKELLDSRTITLEVTFPTTVD